MKNIEEVIDTLHLEDLRNEIHPSFFDENEEYDMLIVRLPIIAETLKIGSYGFILTAERSYYYDKQEQEFKELASRFEGPHKFLNKLTDKLLKSFQKYQDSVSDMEEVLYDDHATHDFMTQWLGLKRDILRIERILLRTAGTMSDFIEYYADNDTFPMNAYVDLHEHIERTHRSATLHLSKLDYIYNFYNARTNEKMNKMVYLLTIISAIFLPLNLVVGFFGMNTSGLPFAGGDFGTLSAVILMISLMLTTSLVVYIWRKKVES
jgi:magnesium transporter